MTILRRPRAVFFDCFGTVFNMDSVPREEIRAYVEHVKRPVWEPLQLPESWLDLQPHPDSVEGLNRLRGMVPVLALSNAPCAFMQRLSKRSGIIWSGVVPLDSIKRFKPSVECFRYAADMVWENPSDCLHVTANPKFGDVEAAQSIGMQAVVIREQSLFGPRTIIDLAIGLESLPVC